jgi:2-hydroxychromene-2-carboxylate isomerase
MSDGENPMKTLNWYFDFISPYAYLQSTRLDDFAQHAVVRCHPVLFAGLLAHHGHKGPAEIASKRTFTYEHVAWLAKRNGIALTFPKRTVQPAAAAAAGDAVRQPDGRGRAAVPAVWRGLPTDAALGAAGALEVPPRKSTSPRSRMRCAPQPRRRSGPGSSACRPARSAVS